MAGRPLPQFINKQAVGAASCRENNPHSRPPPDQLVKDGNLETDSTSVQEPRRPTMSNRCE
jgi:hypothetical protein